MPCQSAILMSCTTPVHDVAWVDGPQVMKNIPSCQVNAAMENGLKDNVPKQSNRWLKRNKLNEIQMPARLLRKSFEIKEPETCESKRSRLALFLTFHLMMNTLTHWSMPCTRSLRLPRNNLKTRRMAILIGLKIKSFFTGSKPFSHRWSKFLVCSLTFSRGQNLHHYQHCGLKMVICGWWFVAASGVGECFLLKIFVRCQTINGMKPLNWKMIGSSLSSARTPMTHQHQRHHPHLRDLYKAHKKKMKNLKSWWMPLWRILIKLKMEMILAKRSS